MPRYGNSLCDLPAWARHPGQLSMSLLPGMLWSVVRITDVDNFEGTGFIVSVKSETIPGQRWSYVVTAHHVIRSCMEIGVEAPDAFTGDLRPAFELRDWRQPIAEMDLAIAPLPDREGQPFRSIDLETEAQKGEDLYHGVPIFYIGVFNPLKVTMVRSGTLGQLKVPITKDI